MNLQTLARSLFHLFFPHCCPGCGTDTLHHSHAICLQCMDQLPLTGFHPHPHNPVERSFDGKLRVAAATSHLYFSSQSLVQVLLHHLKYKNNQHIGTWLGAHMGEALKRSGRFDHIEALIPVPLHTTRQARRGYNQAELICQGITTAMPLPIISNNLYRTARTDSQTNKNRIERWQNMENRFDLKDKAALSGKHLLLVDDVATTGATLEACGLALQKAGNVTLSMATLAFTTH